MEIFSLPTVSLPTPPKSQPGWHVLPGLLVPVSSDASVLWHAYQRCISHQLTLGITWKDSLLNMTQPLWLNHSYLITNDNQETKSVWKRHLIQSLDLFFIERSLTVRRLGWLMLLCPYSSSLALIYHLLLVTVIGCFQHVSLSKL